MYAYQMSAKNKPSFNYLLDVHARGFLAFRNQQTSVTAALETLWNDFILIIPSELISQES